MGPYTELIPRQTCLSGKNGVALRTALGFRWDLGVAYEELVEGAMNDACRLVDTPTWYSKGGSRLAALLNTFRWRTLRCFMAASHCATTVEMSVTADKQLGLLVFESLQVEACFISRFFKLLAPFARNRWARISRGHLCVELTAQRHGG